MSVQTRNSAVVPFTVCVCVNGGMKGVCVSIDSPPHHLLLSPQLLLHRMCVCEPLCVCGSGLEWARGVPTLVQRGFCRRPKLCLCVLIQLLNCTPPTTPSSSSSVSSLFSAPTSSNTHKHPGRLNKRKYILILKSRMQTSGRKWRLPPSQPENERDICRQATVLT